MSETKNDSPINWGAAPMRGLPPEMQLNVTVYADQKPLAQLTSAVFELLDNSMFDELSESDKAKVLNFIAETNS